METNVIVVRNVVEYYDLIPDDKILCNSGIVYCRVSTKGQEDGTSLESQQEFGVNYFRNRLGHDYSNVVVFIESKSGDDMNDDDDSTLVNRELLSLILKLMNQQIIKNIWVNDLSRLSRNSHLSTILKKKLFDKNVELIVGSEVFNFDDLSKDFMYNMICLFNEYENQLRFQKSINGKIKSCKRGNHFGGKYLYGYKNDGNKKPIVDEYESKIVNDIFRLYDCGSSIKDIQDYLDLENVKPPRKTGVWNLETLRNILRNTKYVGHGSWEIRKLKGKSKEYCRDRDKVEVIEQTFPTIVDEKLFNRVQNKINTHHTKSVNSKNVKYDYLLRGLVYCGHCGERMKVKRNKKIGMNLYRCDYVDRKFKDKNKHVKCGKEFSKSINISVTEKLVWEELLKLFKDSHLIKEEFKTQVLSRIYDERSRPNEKISEYNNSIDDLLKKIQQQKNRRIKLLEQQIDFELSDEQFEKLNNKINIKIDDYNNEINDLNSNIDVIKNKFDWYDWLNEFENHFKQIKELITFKDKQTFIRKYVKQVSVFWNKENKTHSLKLHFSINMVKDKRNKVSKYVFNIENGRKISTLDNINSNKITRIINQENKPKTITENYSTVTDWCSIIENDPKTCFKNLDFKINIEFDLEIRSEILLYTHNYTTYQQKLYRLIKFLKEERGLGYRRISHVLNDKGYRSVRTNSVLKNTYIHSIYKKGKIRNERLNSKYDLQIKNSFFSIYPI